MLFIMSLSNIKWPEYMWKEQQSFAERRSLSKTAKMMATKDKKQTTTKGVRVLRKNGQSSKVLNDQDQRRAETDQVDLC